MKCSSYLSLACPIHGTCTCVDGPGDPDCPLHAPASEHALDEPVEYEDPETRAANVRAR